MAATTKTRQPELVQAQQIIKDANGGDLRGALAKAERAARKYPEFRIPAAQGQPSPTFAQMAEWLRGKLHDALTRMEQREQAEKSAANPVESVVEPESAPEPVKVETATLRLVHNGSDPTSIYGVEKGSRAHQIIGSAKRGGLGWFFWTRGPAFYLPRSGGYAPDMVKIREAIDKLEAEKADGVPLYRVETEIVTEVDGKVLPVKMTAEQQQEWQRAYESARNLLDWQLGMGQASCRCGAGGLDARTGRIGKDSAGMPVVQCYTCGGFDPPEPEPVQEPAVDLSGLLALTAEPAPVPESAKCPSCHTMQRVVAGELDLHSRPYGGGACRGKLGVPVVDVDAEPAEKPVRKPRKAAPVQIPVQVEQTATDGGPWRFRLQNGLSGSARNQTATEVRQAILRRVTNKFGTRIETRRDKVNHQLVLTIVEIGAVDMELLEAAVVSAVRGVRGVGNQIHK